MSNLPDGIGRGGLNGVGLLLGDCQDLAALRAAVGLANEALVSPGQEPSIKYLSQNHKGMEPNL